MISTLSIHNYKSIESLDLSLGRVNVFIGENGSGKSNILEAIAFLGAGCVGELDNRLLHSRGVRISDETMTISAFSDVEIKPKAVPRISITIDANKESAIKFSFVPHAIIDKTKTGWINFLEPEPEFCEAFSKSDELKENAPLFGERILDLFKDEIKSEGPNYKDRLTKLLTGPKSDDFIQNLLYNLVTEEMNKEANEKLHAEDYRIFSPENSYLRTFEDNISPKSLGVRGEGLFRILQSFAKPENAERLADLKESLELVGWFLDFNIPSNLAPGEQRLEIFDRYLPKNRPLDQKSSNEGFLFLLFYFTTILEESAPPFFAIDNVDAALNPKLCAKLMGRMVELARKYDKQLLLTTHNPAILDGLNLNSDDEKLFAVSRSSEGRTAASQVKAPKKPAKAIAPTKLSRAFMDGLIGGLPKNF